MKTEDKNQDKDLNKENQQEQAGKKAGQKQDQPGKNHGVPENPDERRNGGLAGAENFKRNMGCGG